MSIATFFPEDVRDRLRAINAASASAAEMANDPIVAAYREGFMAAMTAVALSFGLTRKDFEAQEQEETGRCWEQRAGMGRR